MKKEEKAVDLSTLESTEVAEAAAMSQKNRRHKRRLKLFGGAAALVVFVTTYMLILPAITLTGTPTCGIEEHTHTDSCYTEEKTLTCGQEESAGHTHSAECYDADGNLICGLAESVGHTHTADCYTTEKVLTCTLTEHVHSSNCYSQTDEDEADSTAEESASEAEDSTTDAEDSAEEEEEELPSGDPTADVESAADWEATFAGVTLTGDWGRDTIAIARTQIGYCESTANFISYKDENDEVVTKGYSRYAAWYHSGESSYGDWCAMFCSFCYHYAGVPESAMPEHSGVPAWITLLNSRGQYHGAWSTDYVPKTGDLIFYDWEGDGVSDHVALVADYSNGVISTIEGNFNDMVAACSYSYGDSRIMGYGELPENPDYVDPEQEMLAAETEDTTETVEADEADNEKAAEAADEDEATEADSKTAQITADAEDSATEENDAEESDEETESSDVEEAAETEETPEEDAEIVDAEDTADTDSTEKEDEEESTVPEVLIGQQVQAAIYTDSYYTEPSDDQTIITISGFLPENAVVNAYPAYIDYSDFDDNVMVLRAYDITIFDEEGNAFEPVEGDSISVSIEIPGLEDMVDPDTVSVYYVPTFGEPEEMEAETNDEAVSFDAEHFSTYAVTANTTDNTITVNGVTYKPLANYTETVTTGNNDKIVMKDTDGSFSYGLEFIIDNTETADRFYVQLPANAVLKEIDNEPITDESGKILAYYTINNTTDADGNTTSYILITPAEASTQIKGHLSASGTATKEGKITFNQGGYIYVIPADSNYNSLTTSKTDTGHTRNADGSYTINFKLVIQNTGDTDIKNLFFVDAARLNLGTAPLTYTVPVSEDAGAPEFQTKEDSGYTGDLANQSGYDYYFLGTPENPVTIPANTTYTYTCSATVTAEEFAKIEAAEAQVGTSNALWVCYDDTQLRQNYAWVNYYPASVILSKKAMTTSVTDDSSVIPWQISYNENSRFETSDAVITDTITENAYASGDGIHYLTDYPVTALIMRYGNVQSTIQLTWVEVDDLDNIENPDSEHIYYCGNSFKYFPSTYSGWGNNYGVILQYYTNYDKVVSPTANEAQANFVDIKGVIGNAGDVIGVSTEGTFDSRIQLNKMLDAQNNDNTAEWTVVSSINSTSDLTGNFYDNLPCNNDSSGKKLVATTEKLVNDQKIYANSQVTSDSAYIVFDSVAEFEEVTGIKITITDRVTGAVLDKEAILCGGDVTYTDEWGHVQTETNHLLFCYDTKSDMQSNTASFMIVPNIPASVAAKDLNELKYATNGTDGTGFLPSNEHAGTTAGYNITFTYTTDTSNSTAGETRRNYMTHRGKVVETKDSFSLKAQAYYVSTNDDTIKSVDKQLAKVVLQEDGSYRLTYVTLLDNRNLKTTSSSFNTIYWDDVLSGVDGAEYDPDSLDVYPAYCHLNDDETGYLITTYSSLDALEAAAADYQIIPIIKDGEYNNPFDGIYFGPGGSYDLSELITVSASDKGFRFTMNTQKAKSSYSTSSPQMQVMRYYKNSAVNCWQSFYLVYDVVVSKDAINSGVLRNTVTRYLDGSADVGDYNEFSMIMKQLQKKETQRATSDNDYTAIYKLDVTVDEMLQSLDSFTVQDVMSDNLNMDINSMVVTCTNADGTTTTLTGSDFTARFANSSLTLVLSKPEAGWPSSYTITYSAKVTGDGPTTYENSAWIPEVGSTPQTIESSTYITDQGISDKQVSITIQKYDGNNLGGGGLNGAEFKLERLTNEAQQTLLAQHISSRDAMDDYLSSLPDSSWTSEKVPQPQATATAGQFTLTSSTDEAVYSNVVYRLRETKAPTGYVMSGIHRYFMIYSATADESKTGVTAAQAYAYIYPYVDQESYSISYQIPNYQVNFNVYKTDEKDQDLVGAEFILYSDKDCTKVLQRAIPTLDDDGRNCYNFKNLSTNTTYYVKETKAPSGYYLNEGVVMVKVDGEGKITFEKINGDLTWSEDSTLYVGDDNKLTFVDKLITYELPESGGTGTEWFTLGGIALMLAALVIGFGSRRRRERRAAR